MLYDNDRVRLKSQFLPDLSVTVCEICKNQNITLDLKQNSIRRIPLFIDLSKYFEIKKYFVVYLAGKGLLQRRK